MMIHPGFADHHIFERQIAYFKDNYQLVLLEMPGHGENQRTGTSVTMANVPDIVNQIMLAHDIPACHLLGVSLGSLAAQAFAARYPSRALSVIIVGGYSVHRASRHIERAQRKEMLKWILYILFSMKGFRQYVVQVSCRTEEGRQLFRHGAQRFERSSFAAMSGTKAFFTPRTSPVPYPVLIIVGEHDMPAIHAATEEFTSWEKHAELVSLPGAGHCANADAPDAFNQAVERFLHKVKGRPESQK